MASERGRWKWIFRGALLGGVDIPNPRCVIYIWGHVLTVSENPQIRNRIDEDQLLGALSILSLLANDNGKQKFLNNEDIDAIEGFAKITSAAK